MRTLLSIQYLRAAAALAVVTYHALQWRPVGGFDVGRAGVDVFFVISGFIMWSVTVEREVTPGAFLWRRFTRVAPAYWLITLITAALVVAWPDLMHNVHPEVGHVLLSLAFVPHLDPLGLAFPLLPPGWTLNYEAIFYLVFAAGLFLPPARRLWAVVMALVAVGLFGLLIFPPAYEFGANPMMIQFAAGVVIAHAAQSRALPGPVGAVALVAAALVALAALQARGVVDPLWRPLLWGVPAAMMVTGAVALEVRFGVFRAQILKALGDASYAIYLVHLPVSALVAHTLGTGRFWLFVPAAIAASTAAGLAWRALVEKPLIGLLRGLFAHRPALSAA